MLDTIKYHLEINYACKHITTEDISTFFKEDLNIE